MLDTLFDRLKGYGDRDAMVWQDRAYSYAQICARIAHWQEELQSREVRAGATVAVEADFSPESVALFLALASRDCILVPLTVAGRARRDEFLEIAQVELSCCWQDRDQTFSLTPTCRSASHPLICELRKRGHPGLVLFSSGSTGKSKAALHDLQPMFERLEGEGKSFRAISFLLYDHIGGVNTMLYMLAHGGCLVTVSDRDPDRVLAAVEAHRVELLPTSPTFLNLILLSEAYKRHDLSSLRRVTYGTEPMPESTLARFHELFPNVRLQQTYGLSEVGILGTRSRTSDSLWMKVGGKGFETRIVNGMLEIRSATAMLGYLNAPSPFTQDGWLRTGDAVEVDGEYLRVLGRASEIINVGGEKVYPAEVESVLQECDLVAEAVVCGRRNAITGQAVSAEVTLRRDDVDPKTARRQIREHCRSRLARYKVPADIRITNSNQHGERFKKRRQATPPHPGPA